ncbi:MAG TPA: hypothetical protein PLH94_13885 [Fimbriimonadaceae bacterium]|nr:hypothetical protein [Fimbriimonadaceae bacterium]
MLQFCATSAQQVEIFRTPRVAGLDFNIQTKKHFANITFNVVAPAPLGNEITSVSWTFSGCEVEPTTATTSPVEVTVRRPGVLQATVVVVSPTGSYSATAEAWVIGGPMEVTSIGRKQDREERTGQGKLFQPWILEYLDYDLRQGVPDANTQVANILTAEVVLAQPAGTEFIWFTIGPMSFFVDPDPSDVLTTYYAEGASGGLGDAEMYLFYRLTMDGETKVVQCTSTKFWGSKEHGQIDPLYKAVTCHRPASVLPVGQFNTVGASPNQPFDYEDVHVLQLHSQHAPFKDIWLQERFPNGVPTTFDPPHPPQIQINFQWNGSTGLFWTTGVSGLTGNLGPFSANEPGYAYHSKFADTLSMSGWPGPNRPYSGDTVLSFFHRYHAATSSTVLTRFSVPLDSFHGRIWTDRTTHQP